MQLLQMVDLMRWIKRTCQVNNLCIEAESIHIHTLICFLCFFSAFVANTVGFCFCFANECLVRFHTHTQTHIHTAVRCTVQRAVWQRCFTSSNDGMHDVGHFHSSHMLHEIMTVNIVTICSDYLYPSYYFNLCCLSHYDCVIVSAYSSFSPSLFLSAMNFLLVFIHIDEWIQSDTEITT